MPFADREEAGRRLAQALGELRGRNAIVLAVLDGGVPVGAALAEALELPLDAVAVADIPAPQPDEPPVGAVAEVGEPVFDWREVERLDVGRRYLEAEANRRREVARRAASHVRGSRPLPDLRGKTAIVVDQAATDAQRLLAAVRAARALGASRVIVAVPVAEPLALGTIDEDPEVDQTVSLEGPQLGQPFGTLYDWYAELPALSERDLADILAEHRRRSVVAQAPKR